MNTAAASPAPAVPAPAPAAPASTLPPLETVGAADLRPELPTVNERAVAAASGAAAPAAPAASVPKPTGTARTFDPKIYRTNPDGSPFLGRNGQWMPRGGRRPKSAAPAASSPAATGSTVPANLPKPFAPAPAPAAGTGNPAPPVAPGAAPAAPAPLDRASAELAAEAWLRGGYSAADVLLGAKGEFQPDDAAEHDAMRAAYVAHLMASKAAPPSPFWAWVMACTAYVAKRAFRPNTARTLAGLFPGLAGFLGVEIAPEKPAGDGKTSAPAANPAKTPPPTPPSPSPAPPDAHSAFFGRKC